jgi:hypothetical protein
MNQSILFFLSAILFVTAAKAQVGVNTSTPSNKGLHIVQTDKTGGNGQAFRLEDGNEAAGKILTSDANGNGTWQLATAISAWLLGGNAGTTPGTHFLGTTDNTALMLKSDVGVGININAPTATLDINGTLRVRDLPDVTDWANWKDDFADPRYSYCLTTDGDAQNQSAPSSGHVYRTSFYYFIAAYSDRRMKHNIQPLAPGLSFVKKLQPVEFVYNYEKNGTKTMGFIAQDLQEVMKSEKMDPAAYDMVFVKNPKNGYLGVNYDEMIPILTNAIKEQQTIIDKQQQTIEALVKRIEALEKK